MPWGGIRIEDLIVVREAGAEVVRQAEKRILIGHCARAIHGVVVLADGKRSKEANVGAGFKPARRRRATRHGLPEIVRALKTFSSRWINELRGTRGTRVWQRGYYERVVRSEEQLNRIREYIGANPEQWLEDRYHPWRGALG